VFGRSCGKLDLPARNVYEGENPVIIKYGDYSELDRNKHVNNSKYTAWAVDALYKYLGQDIYVKNIVINYNREVRHGEKVEFYVAEEDGGYLICGYKDGDTQVFGCKIMLS